MCLFALLLGAREEEEAPTTARRSSVALPGAEAHPDGLARALDEALARLGAGYRPRTRHLREDGGPQYSNRLLLESSPYLLQHAHNPVEWYPWGPEAFEAARRLDRPVLLSVGYSTCHWCHVMEEESFEDEEIAAYLNAHYVAIKIDREERPDLDAIYMKAVQMLSGQGGWPMTVWLGADGAPFFGGTYFPPRDGDRGARAGFLTVLRELRRLWDTDRSRVATSARYLTEYLRAEPPAGAGQVAPRATLERALASYAASFDERAGGLGTAPKFPSSLPVRLLLRVYHRTGEERWRRMAERTLHAMAQGGIHDHVGGGFHRYSVDAAWRVPHFEKMLYDNALLALAYLEGYQATRDASFVAIVESILDYLDREMSAPDGAFYSATDADSARPDGVREEGWFFTWTPAEIRAVLDGPTATLVEAHYGVTASGNFEGRSVLHVARPLAEAAPRLAAARERLYRARLARPAPLRDEKILAAWNGLALSAFARAAFVLDRPDYAERAARVARFVLTRMRREGRLLRTYRGDGRVAPAFVDDYACLVAGLLDLYEATGSPSWLGEAIALQATLDRHYWDERGGGYFRTSDDHEALLVRDKPDHDGAEPSGNSIALLNLLRLHALTLDDAHRARAERLVRAFAPGLAEYPTAWGEMLLGLEFTLAGPLEVLIVAPDDGAGMAPLLAALRQSYVPASVVACAREADRAAHEAFVPAFRGKPALEGRATAYVCRGGACRLPITDPRELERRLAEREPTEASPRAKDAGIRPRND